MTSSSDPHKILIIRLSSIGDILLATPLIRVLRKKFPGAQIDFLTKSRFRELLENNPHLNRLLLFDDQAGFAELRRIKREIQQQNYDWLVDIHGNTRSAYLKWLTHFKQTFTFNKRKLRRFVLVQFKKNLFSKILPVYQRYIEPLNPFGVEDDGAGLEFHFAPEVPGKIQKKYEEFLKKHPVCIGLAPGAGYETKRWPAEYFSQSMNWLTSKLNIGIILFGGKPEMALGESIRDGFKGDALNTCGQLSLQEAAALMQQCNVVISNDTGLMHLAAALNKKLVAIFGSTTAELGFFPNATEQVILQRDLDCRPCSHVGRHKCPKKHFRCMRDIQPESVSAAVLKLLKI